MFRRSPIIAGVCCALGALSAAAQTYPAKPVRIIVGFPPGGTTDIMARVVAVGLSDAFKQQFVVDNRPGANSNIGAELVARAPADGYTLLHVRHHESHVHEYGISFCLRLE